jgi:hypothetical protein
MVKSGLIAGKPKVYVAREYSDCKRVYFYTNNQLYFVRISYFQKEHKLKPFIVVDFSLYTTATEKKEELRIQGILSR